MEATLATTEPATNRVAEFTWLTHLLARQFARSLPPDTVELDDLIQDGMTGLIQANERYKPGLAAFNTYAAIRIRGAMMDGRRSLDVLTRHDRAVAKAADFQVVNVDLDDVPEAHLIDAQPGPLQLMLEDERGELLSAAIKLLPTREQEIVNLSFFGELRLHEIGTMMGITESRVAQIRKQALATLRRDPTLQ